MVAGMSVNNGVATLSSYMLHGMSSNGPSAHRHRRRRKRFGTESTTKDSSSKLQRMVF